MKIWARSRDLITISLGAYLSFSPWIFGMTWDAKSSANAWFIGVILVQVGLWSMLLVPGSRAARRAKAALGSWLLIAPFVLNAGDLAADISAWVVGALALMSARMPRTAFGLATSLRANYLRYQARTITPESIIKFGGSKEAVSPERLAKQIVESSNQIRRALLEKPSGLEVEMCALGYRTCAEDMITLVRLVDEELEKSGPIRRMRLKTALRRASNSLSKACEAFPSEALRISPQRKRSY